MWIYPKRFLMKHFVRNDLYWLDLSEDARRFPKPFKGSALASPFNPHIQLVCRPFMCDQQSSSEHATARSVLPCIHRCHFDVRGTRRVLTTPALMN